MSTISRNCPVIEPNAGSDHNNNYRSCWLMIIVGLCAQCVWRPTGEKETRYRSQASINVDEHKNCLLVLLGFPKRSLEGL